MEQNLRKSVKKRIVSLKKQIAENKVAGDMHSSSELEFELLVLRISILDATAAEVVRTVCNTSKGVKNGDLMSCFVWSEVEPGPKYWVELNQRLESNEDGFG